MAMADIAIIYDFAKKKKIVAKTIYAVTYDCKPQRKIAM